MTGIAMGSLCSTWRLLTFVGAVCCALRVYWQGQILNDGRITEMQVITTQLYGNSLVDADRSVSAVTQLGGVGVGVG